MGAQCDQDYLAWLYFFDYFGRRRFIQVCIRPFRRRQCFRYRHFGGQTGPSVRRPLQDTLTKAERLPGRQRLSRTQCRRIGEHCLPRNRALERTPPAIVTPDVVDRQTVVDDRRLLIDRHVVVAGARRAAPPVVRQTRIRKTQAQAAEARCCRQQIPPPADFEELPVGRVRCISLRTQFADWLPQLVQPARANRRRTSGSLPFWCRRRAMPAWFDGRCITPEVRVS